MAEVAPITPKKGEYIGLSAAVAIVNLSETLGGEYMGNELI